MKNLRTILAEEGLSRTASPVRHGDERKLERNLDKLVGDFLVYAELDEASEAIQDFIHSLQTVDDRAREVEEKRVIYGPRLAKEAERKVAGRYITVTVTDTGEEFELTPTRRKVDGEIVYEDDMAGDLWVFDGEKLAPVEGNRIDWRESVEAWEA